MNEKIQGQVPSPGNTADDAAFEATKKQRIASDPLASSWVGASAGSGKTKVLTDRFLRLILPHEDGSPAAPPEKILAITFTRAGANEMALRLSHRLSRWAVMSAESLAKDMEDNLFGRPPTRIEMDAARKLFARVVDTPGGLKIMTIHSFCQSVLGRFPIEAGLAPHFRPLEEDQAAELLARAQKNILSYAGTTPVSPIGQAVRALGLRLAEKDLTALIQKVVSERHQLAGILQRTFGIDGLYTKLCIHLSIPPGMEENALLQNFCTMEGKIEAALREACTQLFTGTKTDCDKAGFLDIFLSANISNRPQLYTNYRKAFVTGKDEPYAKVATDGLLKKFPLLSETLKTECARVQTMDEQLKAVRCAALTRDLFLLGQTVIEEYTRLKEIRGALDFDDLIIHTLSLLKGEVKSLEGLSAHTPWVLYKMDEGIDHILVDEAQDTNPEQWDIIRLLGNDFFNGTGVSEAARTVFVVGDEKQSIFGFQRAAPEKFGEMYDWYERLITRSGQRFAPVDINTSFRSVQIILDAVDHVYAHAEPQRGVGGRYQNHRAQRAGHAGIVELWPILKTEKQSDPTDTPNDGHGWLLPSHIVEGQSGSRKMAIKIGDTIKSWLDNGERLPSRNRCVEPGDIMVLVRSRNAFVPQLIRELKRRHIPVNGADRMVLSEQLVVQDLCAAAAFALLPNDDLTLAALLKSPFIGMSEVDIFNLAHGRSESLWASMHKKGDRIIVSWLESLIPLASAGHPYEFFGRIVQSPCPANAVSALMAIRERLGTDALDPLDEFINRALLYESSHGTGLQGFLKWHMDSSGDIKRQMDESAGMVRIMTVHGAKGLQSPIVFLPDTIRTPSGSKADSVLWPLKTDLDVPLYLPSGKDTPRSLTSTRTRLQEKADDEYRRLLYVAMTRAEDRLYVGGFYNKQAPGQNTVYWYEDIRNGLAALPGGVAIPSGQIDETGANLPILRWESPQIVPPVQGRIQLHDDLTGKNNILPNWVRKHAPEEPFPPRPLIPSRPSEPEPAAASPRQKANTDLFRFRRGTATHRLLQILPDLAPAARRMAAEKFLSRPALGLSPALQEEIARETFRLLEDPVFGDIFGSDARAEMPVTGLLDDMTLISGQIDRLLVREKDILIIDFKTNRPPPQSVEDVPDLYRRQMRAYAQALRKIYPERDVRAALLWTDGARLMEISV